MAPFAKNLSTVRLMHSGDASGHVNRDSTSKEDQKFTFEAWVDQEWSVGVVPNGGYLLGLVLQACGLIQGQTGQKEPLHLSAQYLGSSTPGPCIINLERVKSGRSYCNLKATVSQSRAEPNQHPLPAYIWDNDCSKIPTWGVPIQPGIPHSAHPHALSRRCPLATHPSKCTVAPFRRPYVFAKHLIQAIDLYYVTLLERQGNGQSPPSPGDLGGGGSTWGGWYQLLDKGDIISPQILPFLADVVPELLPDSLAMSTERVPMWFPTLALSADFKYRVPSPDNPVTGIAPRTVGIFASVKFIIEGRYELTSEIWTAPSGIGEGIEEDGWQEKMFCMASVTQSALTVAASVNFKKATTKAKPSLSKL